MPKALLASTLIVTSVVMGGGPVMVGMVPWWAFCAAVGFAVAAVVVVVFVWNREVRRIHRRDELSELPTTDQVILMCGPAGSGKSTYARRLEAAGYVRLSFDETAWHLGHRSHPIKQEIAEEVHRMLQQQLTQVLAESGRVVVDTSFWSRVSRDRYRSLLAPLGVVPIVYYVKTSKEIALRRLEARNDAHGDDVTVPRELALAYAEGFQVPTENEGPLRVIEG